MEKVEYKKNSKVHGLVSKGKIHQGNHTQVPVCWAKQETC